MSIASRRRLGVFVLAATLALVGCVEQGAHDLDGGDRRVALAPDVGTTISSLAGDLVIHNVNVGQGQSTLVVGPNGTTLLIDGGRASQADDRLVPYLNQLGVTSLDYVVLSHRDVDHMGGLTTVLEAGFDVTEMIYDNGSSKTNGSIERFVDAAAVTTAGGVDAILLGEVIELGDGATATCVAVHGEVVEYGSVAGANDENDLSVALLVQYGDFDYIVAGDLGGGDDDDDCTGRVHSSANVETPLAETLTTSQTGWLGPDGVEVLHANHHGSHSSSNSDYFNLLSPSLTLISAGSNSYGHPRSVVVDNVLAGGVACVTAAPTLILQTDEGDITDPSASATGFVVGDVIVRTNGRGAYSVESTGNVFDGVDESGSAGLPLAIAMDEGGCTADDACDDGDLCTNDVCAIGAGTCSNTPVSCDDEDLCTNDSCNPGSGGCDFDPVVCHDGDLCTTDSCNPGSGACTFETVTCGDNDDCTIDSCDDGSGSCQYEPDPDCAPPSPICGDGVCEGNGEDGLVCSADCRCTGGPSCNIASCGDGVCHKENPNNCPVDCGG